MQIDPDTLPDDPDLLQQMLRTMLHQQSKLPAENDKLRLPIQRLTRHQFGRRPEQLTDEQLQFGRGIWSRRSLRTRPGRTRLSCRQSSPAPNALRANMERRPPTYRAMRWSLMPHRRRVPVAAARCTASVSCAPNISTSCPRNCGFASPAARDACRSCAEAVVVAEARARPIDGGMPTEALVTHVLISKFCHFLPL